MSSDLIPTRAAAIAEYLEGQGIAYQMLEHALVETAAAEARATGTPPAQVSKTVVLQDGAAYVLVAIPADRRLDVHKLRDLLGATARLRLATEEEIARDFPTLEVGAIPPFGPEMAMAEVVDSRLLQHERIACPAGDHRHSVLVDPRDVLRITAAKHADICED